MYLKKHILSFLFLSAASTLAVVEEEHPAEKTARLLYERHFSPESAICWKCFTNHLSAILYRAPIKYHALAGAVRESGECNYTHTVINILRPFEGVLPQRIQQVIEEMGMRGALKSISHMLSQQTHCPPLEKLIPALSQNQETTTHATTPHTTQPMFVASERRDEGVGYQGIQFGDDEDEI